MTTNFTMKPDRLYMAPLGGCGMFGSNVTMYGYRGKWIMVDLGMGFADDRVPGIEILLPDLEFAEELGDNLLGIVMTHSHEDHIGAVPYLWNRIKKPIYGSNFTIERIKQAVGETPWGSKVMLNTVRPRQTISLGDFDIEFISVAHSIPEAFSLAIKPKGFGTVVHTGDWKIDDAPVETAFIDEERFKELGASGEVVAVIGDSTNADAMNEEVKDEMSVQNSLIDVFSKIKGAIAVTCFATNVSRIKSVAVAAHKNKRKVCLVGRSFFTVTEAARNCGYLHDIEPFIDVEEAEDMDPAKLVYLCTGSQGETRSALARIADDDHQHVKFGKHTTVIFSSRTIPGNERSVETIKNNLYELGSKVLTEQDAHVHVSGHPYPRDIEKMYSWIKPKALITVHGELVQLEKHEQLGKKIGIPETLIPENGQMIEITSAGKLSVVDHVKAGVLAVEGEDRIVPVDNETILMRRRLMHNGSVVVTVVLDKSGKLISRPVITAMGLIDENNDGDQQVLHEAIEEVIEAVRSTPKDIRDKDAEMSEVIRIAARTFFRESFDRNPQTRVHLMRV